MALDIDFGGNGPAVKKQRFTVLEGCHKIALLLEGFGMLSVHWVRIRASVECDTHQGDCEEEKVFVHFDCPASLIFSDRVFFKQVLSKWISQTATFDSSGQGGAEHSCNNNTVDLYCLCACR
jgi:hypothetical protein